MKIYWIGLFFVLLGLVVLFSPQMFLFNPANVIAFGLMPKAFIGGWMLLTGGWVLGDALTGKYQSLWVAVIASLFWLTVTMLPLFYGTEAVTMLWLTIRGPVNIIDGIQWAALTLYILHTYGSLEYGQLRKPGWLDKIEDRIRVRK